MSGAKDELKSELTNLVINANDLHDAINGLETSKDADARFVDFNAKYQGWYTPALRLVQRGMEASGVSRRGPCLDGSI